MLHHELRVALNADDGVRCRRELEVQPAEVQAGLGLDNAAVVDRLAAIAEHREVESAVSASPDPSAPSPCGTVT